MNHYSNSQARCAIILAAGDGRRLRPLIWRLRGDRLPKQYVGLIGGRSMLERTYRRVEKLIDPECIYTVVGKSHLQYPEVRRQLSNRAAGTVVIQPENKDTGPGILLPLMHVIKRHPDCVVTVFPADHFIAEENLFMGHVDFARRFVERDASRLVLLGVKPLEPETEYGYILPEPVGDDQTPSGIRDVSRFIEKPARNIAREFLERGALWNTLVMTFNAGTVLERVRELYPTLYDSFRRIGKTLDTAREREVVNDVYREIEPFNFSKGFLETTPVRNRFRLSVLPVQGVWWSDWGSESRILNDLNRFPHLTTRQDRIKPISAPRMTPMESINR
jgi:mannose-1-phosphate guanylyltransferase